MIRRVVTRTGPAGRPRRLHRAAPVLSLSVLAVLMGEVAGAALRLSNFAGPLRVAAVLCFYGAGVVLLRETAQRLGLSGWGIVLLGGAALVGFGAGTVWLLLYPVAFVGGGVSFVWWTLAAALFAGGTAALPGRWERRGRPVQERLAACFGATLAAALFGLLLVSLADRPEDVVFQVIMLGGSVAGYVWGRRRIAQEGPRRDGPRGTADAYAPGGASR